MPIYHSEFHGEGLAGKYPTVSGWTLLPFNTKLRGPAPALIDGLWSPPPPTVHTAGMLGAGTEDIVDEALNLFRANIFYKAFDIRTVGDRSLLYLSVFIGDCLGKLKSGVSPAEASKILVGFATTGVAIPGEAGFPLNAIYPPPGNRNEGETLRAYLLQVRHETVLRLLDRLYENGAVQEPSKWWLAFQRRKFLGRSMAAY